jgi:Asp-tRNA(Asn)/Glu-tRNA(Gln) amidotransferase A subunit family amidase
MTGLNKLTAVALRSLIGSRDISPADVLTDCIAAIEAKNPTINAVVTTNFDQAMDIAKQAEAAVIAGNDLGPLHGLPVLIKDLAETKGLRTTFGSKCFADYVPQKDAIIVEKLKAAGAIVIGKTNTPEFGAGANTSNMVFGATGNPFNPAVTSGGSSGGSAAALACDMAPIAAGSDLGGSLRIPASFCSVVGMRPSPGMVPSGSHVSGFSPLWTDGPMARYVEDLALMLSAISGFDRRDPLSSPASVFPFEDFYQITDLAKCRVGFSTDLDVALVDDDIRAVFESRKPMIARHFRTATDVTLDMSAATEVFKILRAESLFAAYGDLVAEQGDQIGENVVSNVLDAQTYCLTQTAAADAAHTEIYRAFQLLFDDVDVLICPATAVSPFPVNDNHPAEINGQKLDGYYAWYAITWALSLVGCPIVTIPCGVDHNGMPFGIQLVGQRHDDLALTKLARAVEEIMEIEGFSRILPKF